ncbi:DNA repair protein RadA/Sms [Rhodothalassium salexigens DSM 2132]|uniref:DNA repair protein RadA n=1 Tax=Rhodothalassium salexigens DSM 2132 TaxID=1188247 RepID=A0A4R2PEZ6_RHOSA|nr:DNA repair protein RadA [Rhodothalassium salexigens]MBB4211841.1 DNA repair protein RadA/Sms [Rhodothalassium salexigens DSM 2132]MBK1638862.1 DNA repair protein RadA [Rhodothalassium salexigens DSM 2132]TCP33863.1 DNA repair protein RadA/Sms [Rhodothalassium salexigens DSM 2132]
MAKAKSHYVCQSCGSVYRRWAGRCTDCGAWNSIVEEAPPAEAAQPKGLGVGRGTTLKLVGLADDGRIDPRLETGLPELDRAVGGGFVPGSAVLIGGDPGIGKSTLLLQALAGLAQAGRRAVYISGEEAEAQVQRRAGRLGLADAEVHLATATSLRDILTTLDDGPAPHILVIDSIQTLYADTLDSAPGTVAQVRACAQALIGFAKRRGTVVLLVGHVTKDGQIAGPRVLEHMVDTVLYFEGERGHPFRILRSVKNRYGGTDEIGVFEMTGLGLAQVGNPSEMFLSDRSGDVSGSAVFAGVEGTRPVLVEIQALVAPTQAANPRRTVVGWDSGRLAMVLAVLDARCGLGLAGADVYLNVAGGLKIAEPAADLAVAAALVSSLTDRPVPPETVLFGEISLSGDIRPVAQADARLKEAGKLGFTRAYLPARTKAGQDAGPVRAHGLDGVADLVALFGAGETD